MSTFCVVGNFGWTKKFHEIGLELLREFLIEFGNETINSLLHKMTKEYLKRNMLRAFTNSQNKIPLKQMVEWQFSLYAMRLK